MGNVSYLKSIWQMFKSTKVPNYDHHRRAIKAEMLHWEDNNRCWIEEGVYFENNTLDNWIALKFNPGDSTSLYSSANRGISIIKCRAPTSAHLEELRRQEDIWDATKGNATYYNVTKQASNKVVSIPAHDFGELRTNIATYCALIFTLCGQPIRRRYVNESHGQSLWTHGHISMTSNWLMISSNEGVT